MIVSVNVGLMSTPVDYTGVIDYAVTDSIIVELIDEVVLYNLAKAADKDVFADNRLILDNTIVKFIGITDDIGTVIPLDDSVSKNEILTWLHARPTLENTLAIRVLTQVSEYLADHADADVDEELYNLVNDSIVNKVGVLAALPIGQYFAETSELDTL